MYKNKYFADNDSLVINHSRESDVKKENKNIQKAN